ncbi:uncharacterized protein [Miscanthus floridulus]|uniref:uncharacterized protein n=1 Tax=Miscanthus floridulus TaxID=154761 RepID=UPI0034595182
MPGVPRELIEHSLNVSPTAKPIKQKLRQFTQDKKEAIRVEITWLLAAGFIKEVYHPDWLANPVLIQKKNKEWRMCVVRYSIRDELRYVLRIHFPASNNAAEYEAALYGLRITVSLAVKRLMVYGDSALVINQVNKDWSYTSEKMDAYCAKIRKLEGKFYGLEFHHVVRDENTAVDRLSKIGSTRGQVPARVFVQDLRTLSIKQGGEVDEAPLAEQLVLAIPMLYSDWREQFIKYLTTAEVPTDKTEMERLIHRSKHYVLVDGKLMWKNAKEELLQKCISKEEGFYWPSTVVDAEALVQRCEGCQFFAKQIHVLAQALQTIPASWPFASLGLDMIGPFKAAPRGFKYVYVAIDKFSKWIEYKPIVTSTAKKAVELFEDIIHRFDLSNSIITDLGSTFTGSAFWDFCEDRYISIKLVSVAHPRANGQVERANGMILDALKKRLHEKEEKHPGRWLKELPAVVWGLRTQPSRNTGVSPYFLVYGSEAVLPADVAFQAPRVENFDAEKSEQHRPEDVDRLEEERPITCVRTAKYLEGLRRYYNRNV